MKPSAYKFFFLALFCATALLSSCARSEGNLASQYEECIFLEDLDAMFSIINDSFPFANMAERMLGINMENKMTQTRAYFENRSFSDANDFFEALSNNFFAPFQFLGHLSLMDAPLFHAHLAVFPPESTWVKILDNPKSRGFYADAPEGLFSPDAGGSPTPNNIATNSIQYGKIAHIQIRTFSPFNLDHDREILFDFFAQIAEYEHLIIDIRGNPGGASAYFVDLIMAPLIATPITYSFYLFSKGSLYDMQFENEDIGPILNPISENPAQRLPLLHPDDAGLFTRYAKIENTIYPKGLGFNGKIWMLVDSFNFSAADYAAMIAKQTGFAYIVGTSTGGGGIGTNPIVAVLLNTGIAFRFSSVYGTDNLGRAAYEFPTIPNFLIQPGEDALEIVLSRKIA